MFITLIRCGQVERGTDQCGKDPGLNLDRTKLEMKELTSV